MFERKSYPCMNNFKGDTQFIKCKFIEQALKA